MDHSADTEPLERPQCWMDTEKIIRPLLILNKIKPSHADMTMTLLFAVVSKLFQPPTFEQLLLESNNVGSNTRFSQAIAEEVVLLGWARSTTTKIFGLIRKVLRHTTCPPEFVKTIKLLWPSSQANNNPILGKKYGRMLVESPERVLLESWVLSLRDNTKNKSAGSLRNILTFFLRSCLPRFDLTVETWPVNVAELVDAKLAEGTKAEAVIHLVCGASQDRGKKADWLQFFLRYVVGSRYILSNRLVKQIRNVASLKTRHEYGSDDDDDDGRDHHRISAGDLDRISDESKKDPVHELMFLLMITTGMRIGGVSQIRSKRVVKITGNLVQALDVGRTLEKGGKWFDFVMTTRIKELFVLWFRKLRAGDPTGYAFPGQKKGHVSTATIRGMFTTMCKAAGLVGPQFHPHALRHSYAHILLETGSSLETVSKLLNHKGTTTTEKFYLKESALQLHQRMNVPWLKGATAAVENPLPKFLDSASTSVTEGTRKKKKQKRTHAKKTLLMLQKFALKPQ
jgi:integrase